MKYQKKILKNGLTLIGIDNLSPHVVTLGAFIRAGTRFDPNNKPGLSHFVEHMVFDGTKSYPTHKKLAQAVERHGGWHTAFTWVEHQKHTMHLPKDSFEEGVKILFETLSNPLFLESEIEREKGVVKEEILTNKSDPGRAIWDYVWFPLFFANTQLARPYSGTKEDIENISHEDLMLFKSTYFQPKNTVLFVAGDLDFAYIEDVIIKSSIDYQNIDKIPQHNSLKNSHQKQTHTYTDHSYYQTSLIVGFTTVPISSQEKYKFELIRDMVGGSFGSPLIQKLRDEGGLIYTWNAFQDNFSDTGYLVMNVSVNPENVKKVCRIIINEFERIYNGNITVEEFSFAKNHLIGSLLANTQTGLDYIDLYGLQELLDSEHAVTLERMIDIYKKITLEDIKKLAHHYLNPKNILVGTIGKTKEEDLKIF